ncbi:Reverse_transcriptase (RNA-dependent DNA polymerase) [Hexamita inflata]|uniref:Reverse transcriptase (RNA-dependent DNA polymerase) n=1 Tax=Hexamita inflata TaxID=28002 RepID=A0AA86PN62_9EUKA|nr:Reverse transcriptase (RNA-dependent DNA polymerase) [Hexamita inflata]
MLIHCPFYNFIISRWRSGHQFKQLKRQQKAKLKKKNNSKIVSFNSSVHINQLHDDFIRSKIETPSHIDRFIGQFKLKESKPNKHTVFLEEDEQIKIRKLRSAVSRDFALQATGKAFQRLEDHYDNVPRVLITEQEALEEFKRKHPDSKNLQFPPLPAGIVMQGQMEPITEDEIKTIILRIKKAKSPGEDGITGQHLKYLVYQHEPFLKILEFFFNQLLNNPRHLQDCKKLFRFRALLIPKKTGGFRPVSCESMILAVFSSCLKTRLMQQIKIHDHQFCFKSRGITHALARVESFKAQGKTLTLADCTNAYQAIDQNALIHSLQLNGVNSLFELQELAALLQPLGLELALNKCSSTQDGGEITFLGQTFSQSSTVSLAERMTAKIDKCLKVLDASPITNHQKFLLLRSVVLPKVNYAPLVDFAPKIPQDGFGNQYGLIDQKVFKYASDLFAVKDLSETEQADFFTNSASKGGLEMVVPSLYYDFMQAQQKAVLAGKCGVFKALRKEYLNTLQDHPGVPAIGYAINNFTYLTDNELFDLIKHRFQVLNKELDSESKCLLCGKKMTAQHEIRCNRNAGIRTVRHDYMVNRKSTSTSPKLEWRLTIQYLQYSQDSQIDHVFYHNSIYKFQPNHSTLSGRQKKKTELVDELTHALLSKLQGKQLNNMQDEQKKFNLNIICGFMLPTVMTRPCTNQNQKLLPEVETSFIWKLQTWENLEYYKIHVFINKQQIQCSLAKMLETQVLVIYNY